MAPYGRGAPASGGLALAASQAPRGSGVEWGGDSAAFVPCGAAHQLSAPAVSLARSTQPERRRR